MSKLIPFSFENHSIRTIIINDKPWFIAADVCSVLGIKNHRDSVRHLDDDEKGVVSNDTLGGNQRSIIVNESGLYALVLRSRKPSARKFTKWVTSEVLPAIRKTGSYHLKKLPAPESRELPPLAHDHETCTSELTRLLECVITELDRRAHIYDFPVSDLEKYLLHVHSTLYHNKDRTAVGLTESEAVVVSQLMKVVNESIPFIRKTEDVLRLARSPLASRVFDYWHEAKLYLTVLWEVKERCEFFEKRASANKRLK